MPPARTKARLPTGVQSFRKLRERGRYYVDKTPYALQLVDDGDCHFLSRPRRFGKSLFVSMLKELFEGNRALFEGLAAYHDWNWSVRRPVVRISFGGGAYFKPDGLHHNLLKQLRSHERRAGISLSAVEGQDRFSELLEELHGRSGRRVALLIDEYDKPILDVMRQPDLVRANQEYLRALYTNIKDCDDHISFCFLTGVTRFSQVGVFSGLNNLNDISLDPPPYSSICGFTERDLDEIFAPELEGLDRERIRAWYNGYSWGGDEKVYNPFGLLLLFGKRTFKPWWFSYGTPHFAAETLVQRGVPPHALEGVEATDDMLSAQDIGSISTEALLFQSGYLTLVEVSQDEEGEWSYRLDYPNREVRISFNRSLLAALVSGLTSQCLQAGKQFRSRLRAGDFAGVERELRSFTRGIPNGWYRNHQIAAYEGHWAAVLFTLLHGFGVDARAEQSDSTGRADLVALLPERIVVFECKVLERYGRGAALAQIKERGYADRYRSDPRPVHLVGVEFSGQERRLVRLDVETA